MRPRGGEEIRMARWRRGLTALVLLCSLMFVDIPVAKAATEDWYKNGVQTTSREWEPTRGNGRCEYRRRAGGALRVTCRNARSLLVYKMRFTSDKRIIDWWVEKHRGNYPCRTRVAVDLAAGRSRITFYVMTNSPRGRAECYIDSVNVTVRT